MTVRAATPEDYAELERLCLEKVYDPDPFLAGSTPQQMALQSLKDSLLAPGGHSEVLLLSEGNGYVLLVHQDVELMTRERQTVIVDTIAPSFEGLRMLMAEARARSALAGDELIVVHLAEANKRLQLWYHRLGFRPEFNRVVKPIAAGHQGPQSSRYRARSAGAEDRYFMIDVSSKYAAAYGAAGRPPKAEAIQGFFLIMLLSADLEREDWHYVILEEWEAEKAPRPAGHIILQRQRFGALEAYYIVDVAVDPDYSGRGLSLYLCGAAETIAGARGGGVIWGYTSPANLAGVNGSRQLGYTIDSRRWGACVGAGK